MKRLLLDVLNRENVSATPAWMMRQAGRYLPEYMQIKKTFEDKGGFFAMCDDPDAASEVTIQPSRRFDIDAMIVFADILSLPRAMGWGVEMVEKEGPRLDRLTELSQVIELEKSAANFAKKQKTSDAIAAVKSKNTVLPLIGFAGAPFTVAMYMMTGGKILGNEEAKKYIFDDKITYLIDLLTEYTAEYLLLQIEAGADVIKIFESHCAFLSWSSDFIEKFHIDPVKKIISKIREKHKTPIIVFPRGSASYYTKIADSVGADCIACDETVSLGTMVEISKKCVVQGNMDNYLLAYGTHEQIKNAVISIKTAMKDRPLIFNLGHGALKHTPIENVEWMVNCIKKYNH